MPVPDPERERVARLAEAADRFAPSLDLKRFPDLHVYKALDEAGIAEPGKRKRLVGAIKAELHRRRPKPLSRRQDLIDDARRLEAGHPKDPDEEDAD